MGLVGKYPLLLSAALLSWNSQLHWKRVHLKLPFLHTLTEEIFPLAVPWYRSSSPGGLALRALPGHFLVSQNVTSALLPHSFSLPHQLVVSGFGRKGQTCDKLHLVPHP